MAIRKLESATPTRFLALHGKRLSLCLSVVRSRCPCQQRSLVVLFQFMAGRLHDRSESTMFRGDMLKGCSDGGGTCLQVFRLKKSNRY